MRSRRSCVVATSPVQRADEPVSSANLVRDTDRISEACQVSPHDETIA
jgi:hypothetical protein